MTKLLKGRTKESIYLEYFNDWLTVDKMAEYYQTTKKNLLKLLEDGKFEHLERFDIS